MTAPIQKKNKTKTKLPLRGSVPPPDMTGKTFHGKYRLSSIISHDFAGSLYRAEREGSGKSFALKILAKGFSVDSDAVLAFEHPNISKIHEVLRDEDGTTALLIDPPRGKSVRALLKKRGKVPPSQAVAGILQVLSALHAAHFKDIVIGNLDNDAVFFARDELGDLEIKIINVGINYAERIPKKPFYLSPEQLLGGVAVDRRADVWAAGVMLFEMLFGRRPFMGKDHDEIAGNIMLRDPPFPKYLGKVPKAVIPILEKALQKEVEDRYPNVTTMVGDLLPLQEELDEPMSEEVAAAIRESVPPPSRATTLKKKKKDPLKQTASIRPKPTKKITPKKAAPPKTKGPLAKANQSTKGNKTVLGVPPVKPKSAAQLKKTPALPLSARPIKNQTPKPIPKIPAPTPSPHPPTGSETAEKKNSKLKVDNSSGGSGVSPDGRGLSESSKSMSEFRSPGGDIPLPEQQEDQAKLTTPKPKSGGTPPPLPVVPVSPPAEEAIIEPTFDELVAEEGAPLLTARATPLVRAISWLAQKRPRPVRAQETIEWVSKNRKKAATIGGSAAALFFIAMAIILAAGQENGIVAPSKLQASTLRESPPSSLESTAAPEPVGASKTATPQTENESTPPDPARVNEAENKTDETIIPDNEHTTAVESEIPEVEKTKRPNRSWKKKRKRSRRRKNKSAEVKLPGSLASNPFGK